jgi:hypothetical protein
LPSKKTIFEMVLKGIKYVLVEHNKAQHVVDYLCEYQPSIYANCYKVESGWFIPVNALDHIICEC